MLNSLIVVGIRLIDAPYQDGSFPVSRVILWLENDVARSIGQLDQFRTALRGSSVVQQVGMLREGRLNTKRLNLWLYTGSDVIEAEEQAKNALEQAYQATVAFVDSEIASLTIMSTQPRTRPTPHRRSGSYGQLIKRGGVPAPM
jgi:hypothetical protein